MPNKELKYCFGIYINSIKYKLEDIKEGSLKNIIISKIEKLKNETLSKEELELAKQLLKYNISFGKQYFMDLFYARSEDVLKINFEQAIERLNTTKEELFNTYEKYIIDDFNSKFNDIFNNILTFKNNYLIINGKEYPVYIQKYEDVNILDEEVENKIKFYRLSLLKNGYTYYLRKGELRYTFNPFLIIVNKKGVKSKKVEKVVTKYLDEEKEYAMRYLNIDVSIEKTYEDENVEVYIVDKRG